jgi:hypothetical protein
VLTLSVLNHSTAVTDAEVAKYVAAQQIQLNRDFLPIYGPATTVRVLQVLSGQTPLPGSWQIAILDDADQAGALGYHELTNDGLPLAKVFARTCLHDKVSWTVCASHEVLEALGDPYDNELVLDETANRLYFKEVADAVEDDSFAYEILGVLVSDFVLPEWFVPGVEGKPLSFKGHVHKAFELATGGYIGYLDFTPSSNGWQQLTARVHALPKTGESVHVDEYPASPRTAFRLAKFRGEVKEKQKSNVSYS